MRRTFIATSLTSWNEVHLTDLGKRYPGAPDSGMTLWLSDGPDSCHEGNYMFEGTTQIKRGND